MSQHSSLRVDSVGAKHRNVLKRFERIKKMEEESRLLKDNSVYGLPKIKSMKVKVKKGGGGEKAEGAEGAAPAKGAAAGKAAAPAAKAAAPAAKAAPAEKGKK